MQGRSGKLETLRDDPGFVVSAAERAELYQLEEGLLVVRVPPDSVLAGKTLEESRLGGAFGLSVLSIVREGTTHPMPERGERLEVGDTLVVSGRAADLAVFDTLRELEVERAGPGGLEALRSERVGLVEAVLSPRSTLVGSSLRELHFREKYGLTALAIMREGEVIHAGISEVPLRFGDALHKDCRIAHIDPDPAMLDRSRGALGRRLTLAAEAGAVEAAETLVDLADLAKGQAAGDTAWTDDVKQAIAYRPDDWAGLSSDADGPVNAVELCRTVQARLDASPDSVLIVDGGEFGQWAQACLSAPNRIINGTAGAIGSAIPFAVAAGLAKPEAPVIALMGDGSAGFHLSEFDTAARCGSRFALIVGNDARWNAEYQIQLRDYGTQRLHSCELNATRYDQVAETLGCHGENVTRPDEVAAALDRALGSGRAACINVAIESHPAPVVRRG